MARWGHPSQVVGQAVVEGVMLRTPTAYAVAVRRNSGEVVVRVRRCMRIMDRWNLLRLPMLRGLAAAVDRLAVGLQALWFSAEQAGAAGPLAPARVGTAASGLRRHSFLGPFGGTAAASMAGLVLSWALPHVMVAAVGEPLSRSVAGGALLFVGRVLLFCLYLRALSRLPEARRLFQYHGAEHKVLAALERGVDFRASELRRQPLQRVPCQVTFMLLFVPLAWFLLVVAARLAPGLGHGWRDLVAATGLRGLLVALAVGAAYEGRRALQKHAHQPLMRMLCAPALWLQGLTLQEPGDEMFEVALVALRALLSSDVADEERGLDTLVYSSLADACARSRG